MGKEVTFCEEAEADLEELLDALCANRYFGSFYPANEYVERLKYYAKQNIGRYPDREAPPYFRRHYGENLRYIVYKVHKTTSWYIFYQEESNRFLIRHVASNHAVAQFL
jgi:hypothetical protein